MSSLALPLAAVEIRERTSDTLPCQGNEGTFFCGGWAREHLISRYGTPTLEHLKLVALAVVIGFAIAFSLALLAHRRRWLPPPLTGRGVDTAFIALAAFNLQIIYRNTIVGLGNVPRAVVDAARGMGQTDR